MKIKQAIKRHHQHGTGLIEVLVAAFIIGIGLLGIAALQITSLQASSNAEVRTRAVDMSITLADRIRANLFIDGSGNSNASYQTAEIGKSSALCTGAVPTYCASIPGDTTAIASCTAAQMAMDDLYTTVCSATGISNQLPGGTLQITCLDGDVSDIDTCTPGSTMTITITWLTQQDQFGNNDNKDRVIMPFIPGPAE